MKKLCLFLIILSLFMIPLVTSRLECQSNVYIESFDYLDDPLNEGWARADDSDCNTDGLNITQTSFGIFPDYSWGINKVASDSGDCPIATSFTNQTEYLVVSFSVASNSSLQNIFEMDIGTTQKGVESSWTSSMSLTLSEIFLLSVTSDIGDPCSISIHDSFPLVLDFDVEIDIINGLYNIYVNDTNVCSDIAINYPYVSAYKNVITKTSSEYKNFYLDDIVVCEASPQFEELGAPCTSGLNCSTGKCENGYCVLKLGGEPCTSNNQCLSGECIGNLCSKPSAYKLLDASKSEIFGDDTNTNNMISLFLMIGIPTVMVVASGGSGLVVIMAMGIFVILGGFFAIIGWLSAFILFLIVLVLLISFIMFMILRGSAT